MEERASPFSLVLYDTQDAMGQWLPSGDIEAPPWERCFAQFLRQLYDRSRSEKSVRDYRRTLIVFFASSAQGGPAKHPEDYTREDVEDFLLHHYRIGRPTAGIASTAKPDARPAPYASGPHISRFLGGRSLLQRHSHRYRQGAT